MSAVSRAVAVGSLSAFQSVIWTSQMEYLSQKKTRFTHKTIKQIITELLHPYPVATAEALLENIKVPNSSYSVAKLALATDNPLLLCQSS
jgi:hypothetical protein